MTRRWYGLVALLVASSAPGTASAQARDAVAAEALFRDGREAWKRGDFAQACPKLRESQRLDPAPGTLLNVAQCDEKQNLLASAWQHYTEVLDQLKPGDPRYTVAQQGASNLALRVPKLKVSLAPDAPSNATITRDDVVLGAASLGIALPADPGTHNILVTCPGRKPRKYEVLLAESKLVAMIVSVGDLEPVAPESPKPSAAAAPTPVTSKPLSPDVEPTSASSSRTLPYVLGAVGVVGIGMGSYFALRATSKNSSALDYCDGSTCRDQRGVDLTNEGRSAAKLSAISFVAGGAALIGGVVLILVSPSGPQGRGNSVQAVASPNALTLQAGGAW
jgi:hypothetical protein